MASPVRIVALSLTLGPPCRHRDEVNAMHAVDPQRVLEDQRDASQRDMRLAQPGHICYEKAS